ncbi:unnamed protein product [Urochloa humidicola]
MHTLGAIEQASVEEYSTEASTAAGKALTPDELAEQIQTTADKADVAASVDRILRYLACFRVVKCFTDADHDGTILRRYMAAPVCRWLTKSDKGSLGPFSVFVVDQDHLLPWHHIAEVSE